MFSSGCWLIKKLCVSDEWCLDSIYVGVKYYN